ncbi:MAG TPA: EAL domain-containing protein [Pseudolabrys sp.]|nr:EAL domain-containing protein [Pseudolabrys sp.]
MKFVTALTYWVIVALWLGVIGTIIVSYLRETRASGPMRLLLIVLSIDILRNLIENTYFGLFFGSEYGLFPPRIAEILSSPGLLIIPKLINIAAACAVLALLLRRWLPAALKQQAEVAETLRQTSEALRQEAEDRRRLFETSLDLVFITDRRGTLLQVSPSSKATLGYEASEMIGHSARDFIYPGDLERTRQEMRLARSGLETRNFETRYLHKDDRVVTLAWSGVWSEPEQKHYFIGRDMSERKDAEDRLRHLAYHDHLTGLPNRLSLRIDLAAALDPGADDSPRACGLALLDIDRFKDINDRLGNAVGDELLKCISERILAIEQTAFRLYRLSADEFAMLFAGNGNPILIGQQVDAALKCLSQPLDTGGHRVFVTASSGIVTAPSHGREVDELIANADLALQEAKSAGGNRVQLFMAPLRAKAQSRWQLDSELRRAAAEHEFILHYQPQIRLSDGAIAGAEALLRWQHPERGLLAPAAFIEHLSETPAALELGRWILREACLQLGRWSADGLPAIRIGVNLFPCQFYSGTLVEDVNRVLLETGLAPEQLELEITENIALNQEKALIEPLYALRARGVNIAFDDFGTGYASLIYLRQYPLTRIKIDQSFVRKISDRSPPKDIAIIRSVIQMAHNLRLGVIGEGVETADQEAFLRTEKCEEAQGYFYSRPVAAEAFKALLVASADRVRLAG